MIAGYFQIPVARLTRRPRAWLIVALWILLSLVSAILLHAAGNSYGAGRALLGVFATASLPLATFSMVSIALANKNLTDAARTLAHLGASRAQSAIGVIATAIAACALVGGLSAAAVALIAHGANDPPMLHDAATSAYTGLLGGAAYAGLFSLASTWGKGPAGRVVALGIDFFLGAGSGSLAAIFPRSHVRQLLGGAPVLHFNAHEAAGSLVAIAAIASVAAVWRASFTSSRC